MAVWATGLVTEFWGSGGGDGDVAVWVEGAELVQEAAGPAAGAGLAGVPAGTEFGVAGLGIGQEVPDDDEDGASDGAPGPVAAKAPGQAAEPLAEEGIGRRGAGGSLGAVATQVRIAVALSRLAAAGTGLAGDRGESREY